MNVYWLQQLEAYLKNRQIISFITLTQKLSSFLLDSKSSSEKRKHKSVS